MTNIHATQALVALGTILTVGRAIAATPAPDTFDYWGAHLGANTLRDWNARIDFGFGTPLDGQAELRRGLHGGLLVGRQAGHGRYELEYERGRLRVTRLTLAPLSEPSSGSGHYEALFANAYRTDALTEAVSTFAGAGIGWGRVKLPELTLGDTCACFGPASNSGFAWQLRAGLAYRLSAADSLSLQYTWLNLPRPARDGAPSTAYERRRFGAVTLGYQRQFR